MEKNIERIEDTENELESKTNFWRTMKNLSLTIEITVVGILTLGGAFYGLMHREPEISNFYDKYKLYDIGFISGAIAFFAAPGMIFCHDKYEKYKKKLKSLDKKD